MDATDLLNNFFQEDENIQQFFNTNLSSTYFDPKSFNGAFNGNKDPLFISLNIQSLNSKYNELKILLNELNSCNIDLIVMQETWAVPFPNLVDLPGFQTVVVRNRQNMRGGGVGMYIRKGLNFKFRNDLESFHQKTFENLTIELSYPNKNILVSNIYHSPNPPSGCTVTAHHTNFLETLDAHLNDLSNANKDAYVFLDANIDLLKLNNAELPNAYMDINISNGFLQIITKATRVQGNHVSLIDHVLSNSNHNSYITGTIISDISDHFINFVQPPISKIKTKTKPVYRRNFSPTTIQNFKIALSNINWNETLAANDVDLAFSCFWEKFSLLFNLHFPLIKFKFNKNIHKCNNYLTNGLLISRQTKLELCKKATKERTNDSVQKYKTYRNLFNKLLRISKKMYFDSNFNINKKNPKKTWQLLKEAANLNSSSDAVEKISCGTQTITDQRLIAEKFNDFFVNIGTEIAGSINKTNAKPEQFMPNYPNLQEIELNEIQPTLICDIIKSLQAKGSTDSDGISTKLLKCISTEVSTPLAHIFNLSIQNGVFPSRLKKSRTVPIFKAGDPNSCDNYRPISLLSNFSKILEKIVSVQLVNHLDRNDILYDHQYGFQRNKSTEHNLIHAFNFISDSFNENKYCLGVFFDLKKAFDVCSADILLMKLEKIGIRGTALAWFKSYLGNRKQFVDINGNYSTEKDIKTCILQGSILGPILFLIYINDLHFVSESLTLMFADDTFGLKSDSNLNSLIQSINIDIKNMATWFRANKLAVNINKTKYIIFRAKGKKVPNDLPPVIYDENDPDRPFDNNRVTVLERYHEKHTNKECRAYKLLGIYLDEHLSLSYHVDHLAKKLNRSMYCMKMAKNNLNLSGLRSLYFALVHSHLSYCPTILNCLSTANKNRLFKIQKKAIRLMTGSKYNAHTKPLFLQQGILPLEKIIKQGKLKFMHSVYYGYAPKSFAQTWRKNNEHEQNLNLRNDNHFTLPIPRTDFFKKMPLYSLALEWNNSGNLMFYDNNITFKRALREQLFSELFEEMEN